jgi:WD40 repeat protein
VLRHSTCDSPLPPAARLRFGDPCLAIGDDATTVGYHPGDDTYFTGTTTGQIVAWDVGSRRPRSVDRVVDDAGSVTALAVTDEHVLVGIDRSVVVWDRATRSAARTIPLTGAAAQIEVGGASVAVVVEGRLWLGSPPGLVEQACCDAITDVAVAADGARVYVATAQHATMLVRATDGSWARGPFVLRMVEHLALSPDDARLAVASPDGRVAIVDAHTGKALAARDVPLAEHRPTIFGVRWTSDGRHIVVASRRGEGTMVDVFTTAATVERSFLVPIHQAPTPVGLALAFPGASAEVLWYDLRQNGWATFVREELPDEDPRDVSWSADGSWLALASAHSLRLFEVPSGRAGAELSIPCLVQAGLSRDGAFAGVTVETILVRRCAVDDAPELEVWDLRGKPRKHASLGSGWARYGPTVMVIERPDHRLEVVDFAARRVLGELASPAGVAHDDRRLRAALRGDRCTAWSARGERLAAIWDGWLVQAWAEEEAWRLSRTAVTLPPEARGGPSRDRFFGDFEREGSCWLDDDERLRFGTADTEWVFEPDGQVRWVRDTGSSPAATEPRGGVIAIDGHARLWLAWAGRGRTSWPNPHGDGAVVLATSPGARYVASYGHDRIAYVWEVERLWASAGSAVAERGASG